MINKLVKFLSLALVVAMMLTALSSCLGGNGTDTPTEYPTESPTATPEESPTETPPDTDSGTLPPDTAPETPADTGVEGDLGSGDEVYTEPEKEKPTPLSKSLYAKSNESLGSNKYGCNEITILSKYTDGLDFDVKAHKDGINKIFYICLPCRVDMSEVYFEATHRDGSKSGPYVADFTDGKTSDNERVIGGVNPYKIIAMQSNNPTVMIQIDEQYGTVKSMNSDTSHSTFAYGQMIVSVTDELAKENGWATRYVSIDENPDKHCSLSMRGRGNATWGYPKKPYQVKIENDISLLGMDYSDTFILLANYRDAAGTRTQIALELGQALGIDFSSDCRTVDFFLNGEYKGMYLLAEKVETGFGRVAIDLSEDVLYEVDNYAATEEFYGFQTDYINAQQKGYRIHYAPGEPDPDLYDLSNEKDRARYENDLVASLAPAKELVYNAEKALRERNDAAFQKYFDVDSWARMYLLQLYTMNSDAYYGSFYFYYDATDGKFHACSPWDFDWSFGVSWGGDRYKDPGAYDLTGNPIMKDMLHMKSFMVALVKVYYEGGCRDAILKTPVRIAELETQNKLSGEMNAATVSVSYFPTESVYWYPKTVSNYDEAVHYFKYIANQRIIWIENRMSGYAQTIGYKVP